MKLYIANGQYVGTQIDAKAISRNFEQVEVPTDKEGLIAYLNGALARYQWVDGADEFETVVERNDPPVAAPHREQANTTVDLDAAFLAASLGQQLTLAAIALEEARTALRPKPVVLQGLDDLLS